MARNYNQEFAQNFNRVLGDATGSKATTRTTVRKHNTKETQNPVALQKSQEKKNKGKYPKRVQPASTDKLSNDPMNVLNIIGLKHTVDNPSWVERNVGRPAGDLVGRAVDILNRPNAMVTNAIVKAIQSGKGEKPWTIGDDILYGAGRGLGGYDKTGWGDVARTTMAHSEGLGDIPWAGGLAKDYTRELLGTNNPENDQALIKGLQDEESVAAGKTPVHTAELDKYFNDPFVIDPATGQTLGQYRQKVYKTQQGTLGFMGLYGDLALDPLNAVGVLAAPTKIAEAADDTGKVYRGIEASDALAKAAGVATSRSAGVSRDIQESIVTAMRESAAKQVIEHGNFQRTLGDDPRILNPVLREVGSQTYRTKQLEGFESFVQEYNKIRQTNPKEAAKFLAYAAADNPLVKKFVDEQWSHISAPLKNDSILNKAAEINKVSSTAFDQGVKAVRDSFDIDVANFSEELGKHLQNGLVKRGAVAFGDHVIPIGPAKMYTAMGDAARSIGEGTGVSRFFSYASNFPGLTGSIGQRARALTVKFADDLKSLVFDAEALPKFSAKDWEILHDARKYGKAVPAELQAGADYLDEVYDHIWKIRKDWGISEGEAPKNYAFDYYKGPRGPGTDAKVKAYKDVRKRLIQAEKNDGWATKLDELTEGSKIKPLSNNALENLNWYINDTYRKISRKVMYEEVLKQYGTKITGLSNDMLKNNDVVKGVKGRLGLKRVPESKLTGELRKELAAYSSIPGDTHWYVPEEVQGVLDNFDNWSRVGVDPTTNRAMRQLDHFTSFIKQMSTKYFPSFHLRNAVTDYFLGSMDGVRASDWEEVMTKYVQKWRHKEDNLFVKIGDDKMTWEEFQGLYDHNASSHGYMASELPVGVHPKGTTPLGGIKRGATGINNAVTRGSEAREDWGRMAHFLHALREELPKRLPFGGKEGLSAEQYNKALRDAVLASTERVNKYHADYGALTHFEKNFMRRVIPFYTYTRRMLPVMLEAMITNPAFFTIGNKFEMEMNRALGGPDTIKARWDQPQWMKDIHSAPVGNDWMVAPNDLLPIGLVQRYLGGTPRENLSSVATNMHPVATGMLNYLYQKNLFTGRDDQSAGESLANAVKPITVFKALINPNNTTGEKVLRTGLGIPAYKLTDARKQSAAYDRYAQQKETLDRVNETLNKSGYAVVAGSKDKRQVFKIITIDADGHQKTIVASSASLEDLLPRIEELLNGS